MKYAIRLEFFKTVAFAFAYLKYMFEYSLMKDFNYAAQS